jgi:hypothetical protein
MGRLCTALRVSRHQKARRVVRVRARAESVDLPVVWTDKKGDAGRASAQAMSLGVCK